MHIVRENRTSCITSTIIRGQQGRMNKYKQTSLFVIISVTPYSNILTEYVKFN
jgi:hypothetical protein